MSLYRKISYHASTILWLSLEAYHNEGIPPWRTRQLIEQITDPGSCTGAKLRCEAQGINHNWNVRTAARHPDTLLEIVSRIEMELGIELDMIELSNKLKNGRTIITVHAEATAFR
jgi:hypothetical protein